MAEVRQTLQQSGGCGPETPMGCALGRGFCQSSLMDAV